MYRTDDEFDYGIQQSSSSLIVNENNKWTMNAYLSLCLSIPEPDQFFVEHNALGTLNCAHSRKHFNLPQTQSILHACDVCSIDNKSMRRLSISLSADVSVHPNELLSFE